MTETLNSMIPAAAFVNGLNVALIVSALIIAGAALAAWIKFRRKR